MFEQLAGIILANLHRPSPHHFERLGMGPARLLTPAFYGCYDWHSCVHMHWAAVRLMRCVPTDGHTWALGEQLREAVAQSLTESNILAEHRFLVLPEQETFELPYGLAWLLQLCAELRESDTPESRAWIERLTPLEAMAAERFIHYLVGLSEPVRSGLHGQTAFAMGLLIDWALCVEARGVLSTGNQFAIIRAECLRLFAKSRAPAIQPEPSPHDFLSPALAEADLMRRMMSPGDFVPWLEAFLPNGIPLQPVSVPDDADGQASHLHGLNLSRAWMLERIASALPEGHPLRRQALALAESHKQIGVAAALRTRDRFVCSHWLPSFVIYCLTKRGLPGG